MLHRTYRRCIKYSTGTASEPPADRTEVQVWILLNTNLNSETMYSLITLRWPLLSAQEEKEGKSSGWQNREHRHRKRKERGRQPTIFIAASLEFWIRAASFLWYSIIFVYNLPSTSNNRRFMGGSQPMLNSASLDLLFQLPKKKDRSDSSYLPFAATNQRPPLSNRTVLIRIPCNILITAVRLQTTCLI